MPVHVVLETTTFEDVDGKTRITDTSVFQSVADQDGMIQAGMEWGTRQATERLEELVQTMR